MSLKSVTGTSVLLLLLLFNMDSLNIVGKTDLRNQLPLPITCGARLIPAVWSRTPGSAGNWRSSSVAKTVRIVWTQPIQLNLHYLA